MMWVGLWWRGG